MIARGRSRRDAPPGLDWHVRLAAGRRRSLRARRAAWSALAVALPGVASTLILGRPSSTVAALAAAFAAVVAAALPVRDAERWAREWIAAQRGLGYETALESPGRDDPYGFWARSRERTTLALRDAASPPASRWWLPPTVALALLLGAAQLMGPLGSMGATADRAGPTRTAESSAGDEPPLPDAAAGDPRSEASDAAAAGAPPERPDVGEPDAGAPAPSAREEDGDAAARDAEGGDAAGSSDAAGTSPVERFLRDLDEARTEPDNPFDPVSEGPPGGDDGGARSDVDVGGRPSSSAGPTPEDDRQPSGSPSEDRAAGSDPQQGDAGDPGAGREPEADRADDQGSGAGDGSDRSDASQDGAGAGQEGAAREGAAEGGEPGPAGAGEAGVPNDESDASAQGQGVSPDDAGLSEGEGEGGGDGPEGRASDRSSAASGEDGAGASASADGELEALPGAPDGPARRLPAERDEGPVPVVGSVRGSGAAPDALPDGRAATPSEARSAERAAEEQGLPGAYREIIRRYFR